MFSPLVFLAFASGVYVAQDGSDLSLHWDVDTDPDSLLDSGVFSSHWSVRHGPKMERCQELDLEHRRGVRIIECSQGHLVLQAPDLHVQFKSVLRARRASYRNVCQFRFPNPLPNLPRFVKGRNGVQPQAFPWAGVEEEAVRGVLGPSGGCQGPTPPSKST